MNFSLLRIFLSTSLLAVPAQAASSNSDSLRHEAGTLAAEGKLDAALALVENSSLPPASSNLLQGKLELKGRNAQKSFEAVVDDPDAPTATRGEAVFRLGQLQYAYGKYGLAISQFRDYLTGYPKGPWADPAAYWMAYSCLQYAQQSPGQKTYLDSSLHYLDRLLKGRNMPAYYQPMALVAKARTLLARKVRSDTNAAFKILAEARRRAPPEEIPGVLLLSSAVPTRVHAGEEKVWEDSLLWNFPFSPEAGLVKPSLKPFPKPIPATPARVVKTTTQTPDEVVAPLRFTLQLGYFSVERNAEEMRRSLSSKGLRVRIEKIENGKRTLFRVTYGDYPSIPAARKEGLRVFKPLAYAYEISSFHP